MKDFGLTDIFQLLGQQQKTGVLNLQEGKKAIQVLFDKGMVVGTNFPTEPEEENPLGKRLMRGGLISPEQWKKAFDQHKEELISTEQALLKNGMVINEDLIAVIKLLTFETIYGLFKWKGGTFRFETTKVSYDPSFVEPLNAEYLLLDVLRMVDEWPLLAERIPTFEMVLQKVNPLATLDVLAGTDWAKKRTFQMEVLFELIDGVKTIQEIMDVGFIGEYDTCKNLITLIDAGLVEPVSISVGRQRPKRAPLSKHLVDAGALLLVGVLAIFLMLQLTNTRLENLPLTRAEWKGWSTLRDSIQRVERGKITNAREVFFLEKNRYPATPEEMVKQGLLAH